MIWKYYCNFIVLGILTPSSFLAVTHFAPIPLVPKSFVFLCPTWTGRVQVLQDVYVYSLSETYSQGKGMMNSMFFISFHLQQVISKNRGFCRTLWISGCIFQFLLQFPKQVTPMGVDSDHLGHYLGEAQNLVNIAIIVNLRGNYGLGSSHRHEWDSRKRI
jgi:hypothetical protein